MDSPRRNQPASLGRNSFFPAIAVRLPHFPWSRTTTPQRFQLLLIFERVHAGPETVVGVTNQLLLFDQSMERLLYQFFFLANVIEDFLLEDEIASVNPHASIIDGVDA